MKEEVKGIVKLTGVVAKVEERRKIEQKGRKERKMV